MIKTDQWKIDMNDAVLSKQRSKEISYTESMDMMSSVGKPIPEHIEPFDLFTSYLFEKHFGDL